MHGNTSCGPFAFITRIPCKHLQDHSTSLQYRIQAKPNHIPSRIRAVIFSESKKLNTNQTTNQFGNTPHIGVRNKGNNRNHIPNKEHKGLHATCCCVPDLCARTDDTVNVLAVDVCPDKKQKGQRVTCCCAPGFVCPGSEHKGYGVACCCVSGQRAQGRLACYLSLLL